MFLIYESIFNRTPWRGAFAPRFFVVIIETFVILIVLADAGINDFNGNSTLVIVGAYSVDKEYRLIMILMNLN